MSEPLTRTDLYRVLAASEPLREKPWTPALVIGGMRPAEVEWVCQAREWVPAMATQLLRLNRELQEERRRRLDAEEALEGFKQAPAECGCAA